MCSKKLKEVSEHLFYEIDMLNISAVKANNAVRKKTIAIDKSDKEKMWKAQVELNLALDSFAIHARNLIEFFKFKIIKGKNYVRAEHYLSKEDMVEFRENIQENSALVKYIYSKATRQVVHLTFDRIEPEFKGDNKAWDLKTVDDFNKIIKSFLELVSEEKLCPDLIKLKEIEKPSRSYIKQYIEG